MAGILPDQKVLTTLSLNGRFSIGVKLVSTLSASELLLKESEPLEKKDNRKLRYVARICSSCGGLVSKMFDEPIIESKAYAEIDECPHCGESMEDKRRWLRRGWSREPMVPDFNGKAVHPVPKHHLPPSLKRKAGKVW